MHQRGNGIGWFMLGTGIGLLFAAAAVALTAELTRRRYYRDPVTGQLIVESYDPLEGLTESLETGLHMLAGAAAGVTESFTHAYRERIKFGLDPGGMAGGGSSAWYSDDDE